MDTELSNTWHEDKFTCPSCIEDFHTNSPAKISECPNCKTKIECERIEVPECVCRLREESDNE